MPETQKIIIPYEPHEKQWLFHNAAATYRTVVGIAGIRSGKSMAGANELIKGALSRKSRWAFIAPTYGDARAILDYTLLAFLPLEAIKDISKNEHQATLLNGSEILWRSADEPERLRALGDLDGAWLDEAEQMKPVTFTIMQGRVARLEGKILITTSPQKWFGAESRKRASWIFELLAEKGISFEPGGGEYYEGDLAAINWSVSDNPYFPPEEIERMRIEYGPLWSAQELDGQYVDLYAEGVFKAEWFKTAALPAGFEHVLISYDPAISEKAGADYSVAQKWGRSVGRAFLIEECRGHWNFPTQKELLRELCAKGPPAHQLVIEDVAYQRALIEDLGREGFAVKGVRPDGDKVARASRLSGPLAAGKVVFADDVLTQDFINEFTSFPNWAHDDRVDAAGYGVYELMGGGTPYCAPIIRDEGYI